MQLKVVAKFVLLLSVFLSGSVLANEWVGPYTIKEIKHIAHKTGNTYQSHMAIIVNEDVNTHCEGANKNKEFDYIIQSGPQLWNSTWLTMALTAQSLGSKVKFYLEGTCRPSGAHFHGISIVKE
ncbi:hypothetical protein [Spartinivicinus poritis]|uniref:Uncharacterized protein n=1 Tax=Spartinivicinus poritis TaxID=2994640 RepID=A0ABT5U5Z6_9GAMM|nr:hypothetical protein [Spartinivicinus sp. A2-2]MDE1461732.1 hypothetical protein [Spartinivicinus sp. A2-2]